MVEHKIIAAPPKPRPVPPTPPRSAPASRVRRLARLFRTLRHLSVGQVFWRVRYRFPVREVAWRDAARRAVSGAWCEPVVRQPCVDSAQAVATHLNAARPVSSPACWNDASAPKLWLYHLHYFEDLAGLHRRDGTDAALRWVRRWIGENPHPRGNGWEPYPASRRVVAWIKAALGGLPLDDAILRSLARQVARVQARLEYHLLANHLFVNAKALVFAGAFFAGRDADRCLARGVEVLRRELDEQVLDDGGHFERSAMYHASFVEDVLDLIGLCRAYRDVAALSLLEPVLLERAVSMLDWLVAMLCPDGGYPRFNDCTNGEAPAAGELLAYAARLGVAPSAPKARAAEHLRSSGFARATVGGWTVLADVGTPGPSYQPGHAHAGTLSIDLYDGDRCVVCGSGVSTYEIGEVRDFERSTMARWAIGLDGADSSEVWAGFRVGRRARVYDASVEAREGACTVQAWHDGYRYLRGSPRVSRRVELSSDGVVVADGVHGGARHAVSARVTLHPDISVVELAPSRAVLRHADGTVYALDAEPPVDFVREVGWLAPEFGIRRPRDVLAWTIDAPLPVTVRTRITRC